MTNQNIKICIGYHKPSYLFKGESFVPVWGGKACATDVSKDGRGLSAEELEWMNTHCIGDDTGDNISAQNRHYCEASILYWMWKHYEELGNPDYIGFLQYRNHWLLNEDYAQIHKPSFFYNIASQEYFSREAYQYKINLTDDSLQTLLDDCDGVFCSNDNGKTIYSYKKSHFSQDIKYWDKALKIIKNDWPKYAKTAEEYNMGTFHVWKNCFIMKREDFLEYCPFLFDVLKKIDAFACDEYENMSAEQMRVPAYVSETMLGIFWAYKKAQGRNFKSCPLLFIQKSDTGIEQLYPKTLSAIKDAIPVVFVADTNYLKYTAVAIQSIIDKASFNNKYDIIILEDGNVSEATKQRFYNMMPNNFSCRFFNAKYYFNHYHFGEFWHKRLNLMPYLKCFIHEILADYEKAIFLDGDLIVQKDIAELYDVPLGDKLLGGVIDSVMVDLYHPFWEKRRNYIVSNKKMENINSYINSGVLLMDLDKMRKEPELTNKFISEARFRHKDRLHHDQDVFNFVLENKIKHLPMMYNYQNHLNIHIGKIRQTAQATFMELTESQKMVILHYDGDPKPWKSLVSADWQTDLWWKYARQTPFYEEILFKNIPQTSVMSEPIVSKEILNEIFNYSKNKIKYLRYKLLSKITFGKKRKKYKQKRKDLKIRLKAVRRFLKG